MLRRRRSRDGRRSKPFLLAALALLLGAQPALAINPGEGLIRCGAPTLVGLLDVTIECVRADTTIESVFVTVQTQNGDDAVAKALTMQILIDSNPFLDCISTSRTANEIRLVPCAGCSIRSIAIENDSTGERSTIAINSTAGDRVKGEVWFDGVPTPGGETVVSVGGTDANYTTEADDSTAEIMVGLATALDDLAGIDATFESGKINIWGNLSDVELGAGNDDPGIELNQRVVSVEGVPALSGRGLVLLAVILLAGTVWTLAARNVSMGSCE